MLRDYNKQSNAGGITVLPHFQLFRPKQANTCNATKTNETAGEHHRVSDETLGISIS